MIPNIKNKTALILIGIMIIAMIVGWIMSILLPENYLANIILNFGLIVGQLLGLIMLVHNGTISTTIYWKIIKFCIGVAMIGAMFKIQHWVGANIILTTSFICIAITYSVRFFRKTKKEHLDILKFLWIVTAYICSALILQHLIPSEIMTIAFLLFWLTIIVFTIQGFKDKTIFEK